MFLGISWLYHYDILKALPELRILLIDYLPRLPRYLSIDYINECYGLLIVVGGKDGF